MPSFLQLSILVWVWWKAAAFQRSWKVKSQTLPPITFVAAVSGRSAEESTRHESDQKAASKDTSIAQQKIASCVFMHRPSHWHRHIGIPSAQELLQNRRKTEKLPPRWRCLDQGDSKLSKLITWRRAKEMHCCRAWANRRLWRRWSSTAAPRSQQLRGSGCTVRTGGIWRLPVLLSNLAEDVEMFPEVDICRSPLLWRATLTHVLDECWDHIWIDSGCCSVG